MDKYEQLLILKSMKKNKLSLVMTINGLSMYPMLMENDRIKVIPSLSYKIGEVVVYLYQNEEVLVHRIIHKWGSYYICKGDNSYRLEKINCHQILGKVQTIERENKIFLIDYSKKDLGRLCFLSYRIGKIHIKNHLDVNKTKNSITYKIYKKYFLSEADYGGVSKIS